MMHGYRYTTNTSYLELWASADSSSYDFTYARFNSTVSLTNYNYLTMYVLKTENQSQNGYNQLSIGVDTSSTVKFTTNCDAYNEISANTGAYVTLNISSLTGNYYIYIGYKQTGSGDYGTTYAHIGRVYLSTT